MGRRVVITGLGALTPIGEDVPSFWQNLKEGKSGAAQITKFDTEKFKAKFACELKNYDPSKFFDRKEVRKYDLFSQYALVSVAIPESFWMKLSVVLSINKISF